MQAQRPETDFTTIERSACYTEISECRICGNRTLTPILSLGRQALTGVFPAKRRAPVTTGPLELVRCDGGADTCGLVQLRQTYDKTEMYGDNYGYHSSLNESMVEHLKNKVRIIEGMVDLSGRDLVIDIGSNDATLLKAYRPGPELLGVDPTGEKFARFYPSHIGLVPDFFSADAVRRRSGERKAKVITSIAMFYDLDAPLAFAEQVRDLLAEDGIWMFEQSYLPSMVNVIAYDTVCHEHLEYYGLRQIHWLAERTGLRIVDVELNDVNGGSFSVVAVRRDSPIPSHTEKVRVLLEAEEPFTRPEIFEAFRKAVRSHRDALRQFFAERNRRRETVLGCGASTKGNVILQYCGITENDLPLIGEINPDKLGCFTPGSNIPIVAESDVMARDPNYLFVFPWHFRDFFLRKKRCYLASGGHLFFPLPTPTIF